MNLFVANEVGVRIEDVPILSDVSLSVNTGEWVSIVGPNGAGKTTLLSVMAGLRKASGSLSIDGRNITDLSLIHI